MTLVQNWRAIFAKAWSVRINLGLALASAVDAAVSYIVDGKLSASLIVFAVSMGASIARIVYQPKMHGGEL